MVPLPRTGVATVENGGLAGSYRAGRLTQFDVEVVAPSSGDAWVDLAVCTELHGALDRDRRRGSQSVHTGRIAEISRTANASVSRR